MRTQGKMGQQARMIKASLPDALVEAGLAEAGLTEAGLPEAIAEPYTTGSSAAAVSDMTLEQAIGVQVRQLRR